MTSQGKLSGLVVGFLPFVVGLLMLLVAPPYLSQLFDPTVALNVPTPFSHEPTPVPVGYFLMVGALVLQITGVVAIWKIVNIKI